MDTLTIQLEQNKTALRPGDVVAGTVSWKLEEQVRQVELRLLWYTQGKGDEDAGLVETMTFAQPSLSDQRSFRFTLPNGPYSFSGSLISLTWTLELSTRPGDNCERKEITVSPTGREILLQGLTDEDVKLPFGLKVPTGSP
ncbi:MAG: hypothetical protein AMJ65_13520 [Phycisphaerae bacterium SG8_4]|nr:MAG: hypothetical protein AMJ65_13520 [Phycisphaerae bacterium SG8_4]